MCQNESSYVTEFIKAHDQIKKERQSIRHKRHLTQKPAVHNAANNSKQSYNFGWNYY